MTDSKKPIGRIFFFHAVLLFFLSGCTGMDPNTLHHKKLGFKAYQDRNYARAIAHFDKGIANSPDDRHLYMARAAAHRQIADPQKCIDDCNRAIELTPENDEWVSPYKIRGECHYLAGAYDEAIADCNRAIEEWPDNPSPLSTRASAFMQKGMLTDALKDCNKAMELDPDAPDLLALRALIFIKMDDGNAAHKDLEKCSRIDPENDLCKSVAEKLKGD